MERDGGIVGREVLCREYVCGSDIRTCIMY